MIDPTGGDAHSGDLADERDLSVRVELVVVDGPEAAAWRERQTAAIRALLEWVTDHTTADSAAAESGEVERRAA